MKTLFLIRSVEPGGAEGQLALLASHLRRRGRDVSVATFYSGGGLEEGLREAGVPLLSLGKKGRWDLAGFAWRLVELLRRERPAVLHSYQGANPVAALAKPLFPRLRLIWGIRDSNLDMSQYDWLAGLTAWSGPKLAGLADRIVVNSRFGLRHAVSRGYPESKMVVVANGIDTERFYPDRAAGLALRAAWGVADQEVLIGRIGRLDPMKDYPTFLEAAARLAGRRAGLKFLCLGPGPESCQAQLRALGARLGLNGSLIWLPPRRDMRAVYSALDLLVSSSAYGEGFPNVVGEAMACGVRPVVTDVGDSALVAGESGLVTPPREPEALAQACARCLDERDWWNPERARRRIREHFSVERLAQATEEVLWGQD